MSNPKKYIDRIGNYLCDHCNQLHSTKYDEIMKYQVGGIVRHEKDNPFKPLLDAKTKNEIHREFLKFDTLMEQVYKADKTKAGVLRRSINEAVFHVCFAIATGDRVCMKQMQMIMSLNVFTQGERVGRQEIPLAMTQFRQLIWIDIFSADPKDQWWEITDHCDLLCNPIWDFSGTRVYQFPVLVNTLHENEDILFMHVPIKRNQYIPIGKLKSVSDGSNPRMGFDPQVVKYGLALDQVQMFSHVFTGLSLCQLV